MSGGPGSGVSLAGLLVVREAARAHSLVRNRRGPSAQPASGKDQGYKPMVKTFGGQRESDRVVVPLIGVQQNAPGGKGPNFDHAREVGKREGMAEVSWSNSPGKPRLVVADEGPLSASPVKVRQLQRALWAAAKQSEGRRFHALFDRVCRGDVLWDGFRPKRSATQAMERLRTGFIEGHAFVVEFDIANFFGEIDPRPATHRGESSGLGSAGAQTAAAVAAGRGDG
jgi:hypothetical protein